MAYSKIPFWPDYIVRVKHSREIFNLAKRWGFYEELEQSARENGVSNDPVALHDMADAIIAMDFPNSYQHNV